MTNLTRSESILKTYTDINNMKNRFFPPVSDDTKRMLAKPFIEFVSSLMKISTVEAKKSIEDMEITVNGILILDINYTLKTGDIVRGYIGHRLNNSGFIAVIE